jgi:hypothetical protein
VPLLTAETEFYRGQKPGTACSSPRAEGEARPSRAGSSATTGLSETASVSETALARGSSSLANGLLGLSSPQGLGSRYNFGLFRLLRWGNESALRGGLVSPARALAPRALVLRNEDDALAGAPIAVRQASALPPERRRAG